jgi:D-alanyl-D-alanine carboxypeptidase
MSRRDARSGLLLLAAVLLLGACGTSAGTEPSSSASAATPSYAADLSASISTVMAQNAIPGAIAYITSPAGEYRQTFGTARLGTATPLSMDDHSRIGSNTKTMTVTVILQLVQEGKLSLDDPIAKFRPDVPDGENITIAQLAEMRSGLFSYTFDPAFNRMLDDEPQKAWTPDELLEIAFSHPNTSKPGAQFEYSNTNLVLLGVVIEELTGMSARDAFQQRIFAPLDMSHSQLPEADDSSIPDPHPQGYQFGTNVETIDSYAVPADELDAALDGSLRPLDQTEANPSWAWTAGGAISTVDDLAVYVRAMVGGGLLDAATQKIRLDSVRPMNPASPTVGYGLGLAKFGPFYGHDGQLPGFSSMMVHDPATDTTVVLFTTLSAAPRTGENAAVAVFRQAIGPVLVGGAAPAGDPAGGGSAASPSSG